MINTLDQRPITTKHKAIMEHKIVSEKHEDLHCLGKEQDEEIRDYFKNVFSNRVLFSYSFLLLPFEWKLSALTSVCGK